MRRRHASSPVEAQFSVVDLCRAEPVRCGGRRSQCAGCQLSHRVAGTSPIIDHICLTETVSMTLRPAVSTMSPLPSVRSSSVSTELDRDLDVRTGDPVCAHIVKTEPGESAQAKVLEARINGTPLEALCGHVWIPSRDPQSLPLCEQCKSIYEMYRMMNDRLDERPSS